MVVLIEIEKLIKKRTKNKVFTETVTSVFNIILNTLHLIIPGTYERTAEHVNRVLNAAMVSGIAYIGCMLCGFAFSSNPIFWSVASTAMSVGSKATYLYTKYTTKVYVHFRHALVAVIGQKMTETLEKFKLKKFAALSIATLFLSLEYFDQQRKTQKFTWFGTGDKDGAIPKKDTFLGTSGTPSGWQKRLRDGGFLGIFTNPRRNLATLIADFIVNRSLVDTLIGYCILQMSSVCNYIDGDARSNACREILQFVAQAKSLAITTSSLSNVVLSLTGSRAYPFDSLPDNHGSCAFMDLHFGAAADDGTIYTPFTATSKLMKSINVDVAKKAVESAATEDLQKFLQGKIDYKDFASRANIMNNIGEADFTKTSFGKFFGSQTAANNFQLLLMVQKHR